MLVCCAPTEDANAEVKDAFYDQLQTAVESVHAHDVLFILGDLNAKVRSNNTGREHFMGKHGIGTINDNGERLADVCEENNLLIGGTLFQQKHIHKTTWTSPDGTTKKEKKIMSSSIEDGEAPFRMSEPTEEQTSPVTTPLCWLLFP